MLLFVYSLLGFSQTNAEQTEIQFHPHWLLQVQGGLGYTLGELKFDKLESPSLGLSAGYQFSPVWGVRAGVSGWQSKGGWVTPEQTYKYKYLQLNADAVVNLSNALGGYRHDRFFNSYVFGGAAYNQGFDNDEAVALSDAGVPLRYLWRDKRSFVAGRMGIGFDFRFCDRLAFNLEGNANVLSDHYNSKKAGNADWHFNVLAGFTFRLGKTHTVKKKTPREVPVIQPVMEKEPQKNPIKESQIEKQDPVPVVTTLRKEIFFTLNSSEIQEKEAVKVSELAHFLSENSDNLVEISGYADAQT